MNQRENHCHFQNVRWMASLAVLVCLLVPVLAKADSDKEQERLKEAGDVIKDLLSQRSRNSAGCFEQGGMRDYSALGEEGRVHCCRAVRPWRDELPERRELHGTWSAPIMMQSSGGSVGFQAGGQATDFVVLVMNDKGARTMLNGKLKLGGDASVAAGPVGRTAEASTNASP